MTPEAYNAYLPTVSVVEHRNHTIFLSVGFLSTMKLALNICIGSPTVLVVENLLIIVTLIFIYQGYFMLKTDYFSLDMYEQDQVYFDVLVPMYIYELQTVALAVGFILSILTLRVAV